MRFRRIFAASGWALAAIIAVLGGAGPAQPAAAAEEASGMVFPSAGRIGMTPPPGYAPSSEIQGFQNAALTRSIVLLELPERAYDQLPNAELIRRMPLRGMSYAGECAALNLTLEHQCVRATQIGEGIEFSKWIVIFRARGLAGMATLTIPTADPEPTSELAALSSITVRMLTDEDRLAVLPFTFDAPAPLSLVETPSGLSALYEHPDPRRRSLLPLMFLASSVRPISASSTVAWGLSAMMRLGQVEISDIESEAYLTHGAFTGSEIIATGVFRETGANVVVYQAVLADDQRRYLRAVGIADAAEKSQFLEIFRRTSLSMRRR